jgi:ACT domain-containing protein
VPPDGRVAREPSDGGVTRVPADVEESPRAYTVRLELVDEPGELLRALEPIAEHGGNLLSIHHERGNLTPRGHIPVAVDVSCRPSRFDDIVDALRDAGVSVIRAGEDAYTEEVTVVLVGHLVESDLSDTLSRVEACAAASVTEVSLDAPEGTADVSSVRIRLAVEADGAEDALEAVRAVADEKDLQLVEPLVEGSA